MEIEGKNNKRMEEEEVEDITKEERRRELILVFAVTNAFDKVNVYRLSFTAIWQKRSWTVARERRRRAPSH